LLSASIHVIFGDWEMRDASDLQQPAVLSAIM
jgi:hypothetical protein